MSAPLTIFAPEGLGPQANAVAQMERVMAHDRVVAGALMADHHLGYSQPIGGVVAYHDAISPSGVGYDIGCGNQAVRTEIPVSYLAGPQEPVAAIGNVANVMREVARVVSFGLGRKNPDQIDHPLFDEHATTLAWLEERVPGLTAKARAQLGTVGSGNHYVDLLGDDDGFLWVANHFGSRGLGHTIATGFLNLAAGRDFGARGGRESEEPTVLPLDTEVGQRYFDCMTLAGAYADAGRDHVIDTVLAVLGAPAVTERVKNHHNYAWYEDGLWVVRKGATPLSRAPAFIGGSMGDVSVIVRGTPETIHHHDCTVVNDFRVGDVGALRSAPHGAGRVMSRTAAAGKVRRRKHWGCPVRDCAHLGATNEERCEAHPHIPLRRFSRTEHDGTGVIDWPAVQADLAGRGIIVVGAGADEAPAVYKPLRDVIAAHPNIEVLTELHPLGVVMAGADEFDPFRD